VAHPGALTLSLVVGPALRWLQRDVGHEWWRVTLAFLGAEVMAYAIHRAMHEVPQLWRFHRVHHEPRELTWTTAWRQHPVDVALHAVAVALPGLLLGVSLSSFALLVLARRLWTGLLHANVKFEFGWLEGVIATPKFHHLHHSTDPRFFNANYAGLLPILDVLARTRRANPRQAD
jgi:sterol desaturase/sphingolipid hydroxylase (fatty acid hydroxylase superfamily)